MPTDKANKAYDLQMDIFYEQKEKLIENIDNHMDLFISNKKSKKDDFFRINEISEINKNLTKFNNEIEKSVKDWENFKPVETKDYLSQDLPLIK